jgi:Tfp pilus assembly protein PilN
MSLLDIDFAAAPRRGSSLVGLVLLLLGAAALGLVWLDLDDLEQEVAAAETRLQSRTRRPSPTAAGKAANIAANAGESAASAVLARLRTPWPELLEQLETLSDLPVAVLDVEAQANGRSLRLAGEAKTMDEVLAYLEQLRQSRRFDEVVLRGHELRRVGASEVVAFTLQATWPATRDTPR